MLICNRFHGRFANNGKITTFRGSALTPSCAGFLEPKRSRLGPLKSRPTFNAENFICSLS